MNPAPVANMFCSGMKAGLSFDNQPKIICGNINKLLAKSWGTLGSRLEGKLHVYAGEQDTFYLNGAVALLQKTLHELGAAEDVQVIADMSHQPYAASIRPMFETMLMNFEKALPTEAAEAKP